MHGRVRFFPVSKRRFRPNGIQSNRRLNVNMWRAVILLSLFTANLSHYSAAAIRSGLYTEGGSYRNHQHPLAEDLEDDPRANYAALRPQYFSEESDENVPSVVEQQLREQYEQQQKDSQNLQNIVEQLRGQQAAAQARYDEDLSSEDDTRAGLKELQRLTNKIHRLERNGLSGGSESAEFLSSESQPYRPSTPANRQISERPLSAQKKGQSEFVEFVEPRGNNALNGIEFMEKRVPLEARDNSHSRGGFGFIHNGNVIFLAFVAMCCVVAAVGVVGGSYYYYHVRAVREDPFDDFTRYSPAGPGRDRFKKNSGGSPLGEKGDDVLAYKAQLHHYQQTKQKIIGGDGSGVTAAVGSGGVPGADLTDRSDDEDDGADLEHNFSVYECPGLAPIGDIEVQNPNFVEVAPK